MDWIDKAQQELKRQNLAGWLIYDFRGINPVAKRFVDFGPAILSRRWFLFVPASGDVTLLIHAIERGSLPTLPFEVKTYSSRQSLLEELKRLLPKAEVALEYSPMGDNPYVSHVDGGTVELLRALGISPASSANLLQAFSAWNESQVRAHLEAAQEVMRAKDLAFAFIAEQKRVRETDVQSVILEHFKKHNLTCDHPPIVAFGPHSADPHYAPVAGSDRELSGGDAILIDLWAKKLEADAPYADITWMGVCGKPSEDLKRIFSIVTKARDLAVGTISDAYERGRYPQGREIDRAVRDFITNHGYGDAFTHRTGHSLGSRYVHGEAAHLDDFETADGRELLPGSAITIEPGIYLEDFGVRSEINVVLEERGPSVTTERQEELIVVPRASSQDHSDATAQGCLP